jgi:hypothetical protein
MYFDMVDFEKSLEKISFFKMRNQATHMLCFYYVDIH